jgi:hypothetical protein
MQANKLLRPSTAVLGELSRPSLLIALLFFGVAAFAPSLAAQTRATESAIAGAAFPVAAADWSADADGSKAATVDLAAALAGSDCEAREAFAWNAASQAAAESVRTRTQASFQTAGWSLQPVSRTSEGQRILLARRGSQRLVMVWQPGESGIGLLMCSIESAPLPAPPEPGETTAAVPPSPAIPEPPLSALPETSAPLPPEGRAGSVDEAPSPEAASPAAASDTPMAPPAVVDAPPGAATNTAANIWLRLVAVGFLVLGGVSLIVRDFRAGARSVEWLWPAAAAIVEHGWVEEDERDDGSGTPVKTYTPILRYRYHVDGEEFQGGNIGLEDRPLSSADAAARLLSRYPDFTTIEVRYDPEDPSFAVIEAPRPPPGQEFYFGLGAIVLACAVLAAHLR